MASLTPEIDAFQQAQGSGQRQQMGQLQQIGMLQGILSRQRQLKMDEELRGALSRLPPDATQEDIVKAIAPYAGAGDLLRTQQSSADRKATIEAANINRQATREQTQALQTERLTAQAEIAKQRSVDMRATEQDRIQARRELAQLTAALRQPQQKTPIAIMGDDGKPVLVSPENAIGKTPFNVGDKAAKAGEKARTGREDVNSMIATLRDQYGQLLEGGGITDPSAGPLDNLKAGVASSGIGQFAGRMFGTQNQSARNQIAQQRPLLLNAIKQATGMSAKQMDSNAELKLYLSAATDPTLDIRANMAALEKLDELYGLGGKAADTGGGNAAAPRVIDFSQLPKRR